MLHASETKKKLAARMSLIGIVIPGSQIPGLAKPKSRDFGIEKIYFSVENSIYSMIFAIHY